jgi:hypothetical protein
MPNGDGANAPIDLRIGACARVAKVSRDEIHAAMRDGGLPFRRDGAGHRVAVLEDLVSWIRRRQTATVQA